MNKNIDDCLSELNDKNSLFEMNLVSETVKNFYKSGSEYYEYLPTRKKVVQFNRSDLLVRLKSRLNDTLKEERDSSCGELVDRALIKIQNEKSVDYAGELTGFPVGLITTPLNKSWLITNELEPVEPVAGEWRKLHDLQLNMFGHEQLEYWLGHTATFVRHLHRLRVNPPSCFQTRPGQVVTLAGPAQSGKTLLMKLVARLIGSATVSPYSYLMGKANFNGELVGSAVLVIDDEAYSRDWKQRGQLASGLKNMLFSGDVRIEAKFQKPVSVPLHCRIYICTNENTNSMLALPALDEGIRDKISYFKIASGSDNWDSDVTKKEEYWNMLLSELPAFANYLLNEHQISDDKVDSRTGVKAFHHPEIATALEKLEPRDDFKELLFLHFFIPGIIALCPLEKKGEKDRRVRLFRGKASSLQREIESNEKVSSTRCRNLFRFNNSTGTYLRELHDESPLVFVKSSTSKGSANWEIWLSYSDLVKEFEEEEIQRKYASYLRISKPHHQ